MMTKKKGVAERLRHLDTRILYAIALLIIVWLYYVPAVVPIPVSDYTMVYYKTIEDLPSKAVVILAVDFSSRQTPECYPGLLAMTEQLLSKDVRILAITLNPQGYIFIDNALHARDAWSRKQYGTDFVNLGWLPGDMAGVSSFAKDIRSVIKKDYYGTSLDDLPMMKNVDSYRDISIIVEVYSDEPGVEVWARQMVVPYQTRLAYFDIQAHLTDQLKYYKAGLAVAILSGLRGSAELEFLMKKPLVASRNMATQTALGVFLLFCMVMANVNYFGARGEGVDKWKLR